MEATTSSIQNLGPVFQYENSEDTPLLVSKERLLKKAITRYKSTRKCVTSKSALLILFWSFVLGLWNGMALYPDLYLRNFVVSYSFAGYIFVAIVFCFFPLAGFLADVKYGRYKVIIRSLLLVLMTIPPLLILLGSLGGLLAVYFTQPHVSYTIDLVLKPVFVLALGVLSFLALVALIASYVGVAGFTANVIQFGMDQLLDSPGEDRTLFIHWYVWTYFISIALGQVVWNFSLQYPYNYYFNYLAYYLIPLLPLSAIVLFIISLCLARAKRNWFLIEPGRVNPYKLVYRVTKFAWKHKTPIHRSAFTYCEDEIPTGLDLGKEKYGGYFTTEQVEDVKVFYGILKVLLSFGAVFFLDFAATSVLPMYAVHMAPYSCAFSWWCYLYNGTRVEYMLFNSSLMSPVLILVCIPLYLCLLRPFVARYVPGMLKRMGSGMILVLLSLIASFAMDAEAHMSSESNSTVCMFTYFDGITLTRLQRPLEQNSFLLTVQLALSALAHILIYVAAFEFICSQSPHSMKGLLIGLLYAIKGLYQLLATFLAIAFTVGYSVRPGDSTRFSCGFYYYLVNIVIGLVVILVYTQVAKRYRYRERETSLVMSADMSRSTTPIRSKIQCDH